MDKPPTQFAFTITADQELKAVPTQLLPLTLTALQPALSSGYIKIEPAAELSAEPDNPSGVAPIDPGTPGQIAAPFAGAVTPVVQEGQRVTAGQTVATIEAMKMEASITTPVAGTVRRVAIGAVQQLEGGDLVMVVA